MSTEPNLAVLRKRAEGIYPSLVEREELLALVECVEAGIAFRAAYMDAGMPIADLTAARHKFEAAIDKLEAL